MADNQQHLVNIAKAIEKGTRVTTLDELKAKGQNQVKVINAAKIMELIREAVDLAIDSMSGQKLSAERERLQSAAKKEFDELFKKYQDTQKSKEGIEGQASKMQSEIDAIQKLLAGGGGGAEAQMGLAGLSGQISGLVQKLQASEKARIDMGSSQQRMERELADLKAKLAESESAQAAAVNAGRGVAQAVDAAYAKIDAGLGMKARELGLFMGAEPRTPEEKMQRLAEIAEAAANGLEKERGEKAQIKRQLDEQGRQMQETVQAKGRAEAEVERLKDVVSAAEAKKTGLERELAVVQEFKKSLESKSGDQGAQISRLQSDLQALQSQLNQTVARKQVSEKELGELQEFKRKLEEKVSESGDQYAEVHQMMAQIGKRADDLIHEVEHGRLKHLKPEEKKIILDAMADVKEQVRKLQEERAFLEKKLFYMSMTIDSLEAELLAAKGLTPSVGGSVVKDDGLQVIFDEAGVATL